MIKIKTDKEVELLRRTGEITRNTLLEIEKHIKPGITTKQLDKIAYEFILKNNAKPSFLHYGGFPASICASKNEVVVHGFPDDVPLVEGDIISIDVGACYKGYHGDSARTFPVGKISDTKQKLIDVTKQSFFEGIKNIKAGNTVGDISSQVQRYVEKHGFGVVREMVGHGVGKDLHEDPNVPNYGYAGLGPKLRPNMVIAIEPMVNAGSYEIDINGWSVVTKDKQPSAHYENTVLITETGVEILT
jgi:methionyl aminopeptidase